MDGEIWGEATVTHPDWNGTAQLDERMTGPWKGFARTFGLDSEQWQVVGFSLGGGEQEYDWHLHVLAKRSDAEKQVSADDHEEVEVTDFLVHHVDPLAVLRQMAHMFDFRMRSRSLGDRRVRVVELLDLPPDWERNPGPQ